MESGSEYPTNMASYPSSAIFGQLPSLHSASSSTPSASTSTSDSASPYPTFPKGKRPLPDGMQNFPPFLFGVDPGIPAMSTFLPVNQTDGATPSFPGYPDAGGLAGQLGMETMYSLQNTGIHNMPGQNYDLNHCYSRSNLAGPSRYPSTDTLSLSAPAPSRPPVPSYSSPSHPVAPLPQSQPRPWVPQDRGPWQEPTPPEVLDFSALTAGSAAFSARIKSPDQVQQGPGAEERRQAVLSLSAGMGGSAIEEVPFPQDFSLGLSTGGVQDYPRSAAYPDNLYGSLPDGLVGPDFGAGAVNQGAGTDTGRALEIYEHVLATLPHIRPTRDPPPNPPPLQPLLDLSYEAQSIISKLHPPPIHTDGPTQGQSNGGLPRRHSVNHPAPSGTTTIGTARRAGKEKGTTKCTGCGATETPEWRRGPLGPRTLCNACGLVHMKIQKKKEKQEEKAAAKAAQAQAKTAAAGGEQGSEAAGGRVKRVKREETA